MGTKQVSSTEAYPVLLGDVDPAGNLNASILHQFGSRLKTKFAAQVQRSKYTAVQLTSDYRGDKYTCSATLGNVDFINCSGKLTHRKTKSSLCRGIIIISVISNDCCVFRCSCVTLSSRYNTCTLLGR